MKASWLWPDEPARPAVPVKVPLWRLPGVIYSVFVGAVLVTVEALRAVVA